MNPRMLMAGPIAKGTVTSLTIRLGGIVLGTAQALLTARLLGPEGYGSVAYVLSLSMLLATLVLLGTEPLAVREVARLKALNDMAGLKGFMFAIRWMVGGAALLVAVATALILPGLDGLDPEFRPFLLYTVALFPIFAFILQTQGALLGFGNVVMAQVPFQVVRQAVLVSFLAIVWFMGLNVGPQSYLNAAIVGAVIALAVVLVSASRQYSSSEPRTASSLKWISTKATPFFASSVLILLLAEINTLMLAWWTDAEQTGLFQPIARIAPLIILGAQAVSMRYAPRVSEFWTNREIERLKEITRLYTMTTTAFALALAVFILLLDDFILGLFGEAFTGMTTALWWVIIAQVFNTACGPVGILLNMSNRAGATIWPLFFALCVCLATGYAYIPDLGALGAAVAMSVGVMVWNLAMLLSVKRHLNFDPSLMGIMLSALRART